LPAISAACAAHRRRWAHTRSETYSIGACGNTVRVALTSPTPKRAAWQRRGATVDDDQLTPTSRHMSGRLQTKRVRGTSGPDGSALPGVRRVELTSNAGTPIRRIALHGIFELVPTHTDLRKSRPLTPFHRASLQPRPPFWTYRTPQNPLQMPVLAVHRVGIMQFSPASITRHFCSAWSCCHRPARPFAVITGFTIGHSATLHWRYRYIPATRRIHRPSSPDDCVGGAECLASHTGRPNGISFVIAHCYAPWPGDCCSRCLRRIVAGQACSDGYSPSPARS